MPEVSPAQVLILATPSQRGRRDRLIQLLANHRVVAEGFPRDADDETEDANPSLVEATKQAAVVVLLADQSFVSGRLGDRSEVQDALIKIASRLMIVVVDEAGRSSLSLPAIDVFPTSGSLANLDEGARAQLLENIAMEVAAEVDPTNSPQQAKLFDEYRLLFESTDRLVQRRRETTQVFFGVNAALSAVIAFLIKDLALPGPRLSLVTVPLFVMGMVASQLWRRTIEQYATLIDWRYRQIRRLERRGFVGSYQIFNREWQAIYAPKPPGTFSFSGLEGAVPKVFLVLHILGAAFAMSMWLGWLEE